VIGRVEAHHPLLNITFRLPGQPDLEIECVIDTGFVGYLTLPLAAVSAMNLPFIRRMPANLADDSTIMVEVYVATIVWNGGAREEEVLATGRRPLVGTLLLNGSELNVQFVEGGLLSIETM
jgi:clan AA aspartic protease